MFGKHTCTFLKAPSWCVLQAIVEDILLKSGLARPGTSTYGSTYMAVNGHKPVISAAVYHAVEVYALDRLCSMLLTGKEAACNCLVGMFLFQLCQSVCSAACNRPVLAA